MNTFNIQHTVEERFLRYVKIDTQSDPISNTCPSTEKQKNLALLLVQELHEMGISNANMDDNGYVYASIAATTTKKVPVICFCSHIDTSPDCSGTNIQAIVHKNYNGKDIVLPHQSIILKPSKHPELLNQIGNDIITADGNTLLGADDKAGLAEIMDAANYLSQHPEMEHGMIKILFTPDEEIGRGVDKVNLSKLAADFCYTMDGETAGTVEDETFSADEVTLIINGVSVHPGFAKGKMENALKIAAALINNLPKTELSPETTELQQGFIHPTSISGTIEKAVIKFIIRDFNDAQLLELETFLKNIADKTMLDYPKSTYELIVKEQYRNMKQILNQYPQVLENAIEALRRTGFNPIKSSIRGGTDGSRLSYMGLPTPNIFAGGHAFHSKQEWVSVQDMQKATETILHLVAIWAERS